MAKLKYIVLSDLHLGEKNSLFTPLSKKDYRLISAFGQCLLDLVKSFNQDDLPKLILNGDILGLSFSNYQTSLPIFKKFLSVLTNENKICDSVIYIPGNHDHHIWNLTQEEEFKRALENLRDNDEMPEMRSISKPIYSEGIGSEFFESLLHKSEEDNVDFKIFYPNYLSVPKNENDPFIMFHHGHFSENTYHFVTRAMQAFFPELPTPKNLNELEASNGNWIDFAFSELGRSGEGGKKFTELMAILSDKEKLKDNIDKLSQNFAESVDFPYLPFDFLEAELTRTLMANISEYVRSERYEGDTTCSDETMQGLMKYLNEYCYETIKNYNLNNSPSTLVWSHTHKPFQKYTETEKFGKLKVVNTGGWVLPPQATPVIGASIVLVDESNDCQSLRIYNDDDNGGKMHFKVMPADGEQTNNFIEQINGYINNNNHLKPVWAAFKDLLVQEIKARRSNGYT